MRSSSLSLSPLTLASIPVMEMASLDFDPAPRQERRLRFEVRVERLDSLYPLEPLTTPPKYADLSFVVPNMRGKSLPRGCLSTGRQAVMVPRLASISVHMPRSIKLYVMSSLFLRELETEVTRRMDVKVTLASS